METTDSGERATKRIRTLELHHAIASLERAFTLIDDPLRHDIEILLDNARQILELSVIGSEGR